MQLQSIKAWGIWQSFNTPTDIVLGTFCLLLIAFILRLIYLGTRPSCAVCNKRRWFWQMTLIVTSGSSPETCEVASVCRRHYSCQRYQR